MFEGVIKAASTAGSDIQMNTAVTTSTVGQPIGIATTNRHAGGPRGHKKSRSGWRPPQATRPACPFEGPECKTYDPDARG